MKNDKKCYPILLAITALISYSTSGMEQKNNLKEWSKEERKLFTKLSKEMIVRYNDHCTICLETFDSKSNYTLLSCAHAYHKDCIGTYFNTISNDLTTKNIPRCPICKKPFVANDVVSPEYFSNLTKEDIRYNYDRSLLFDLNCIIEDVNQEMKLNCEKIIHNFMKEEKQERTKKLWAQIYHWGRFFKMNLNRSNPFVDFMICFYSSRIGVSLASMYLNKQDHPISSLTLFRYYLPAGMAFIITFLSRLQIKISITMS